MSDPLPTLLSDGDFTVPAPVSSWKTEAPFEADNGRYIGRQTFVQIADYFSPLALNSPHPLHTGFYLVEETPHEELGIGDLVQWTRIYARVPAPRSDYESFAAVLPGLSGAASAYHRISATATGSTELTITTEDAHGLSNNDPVLVAYYIDVFDINERPFFAERLVNSVIDSTKFKVNKILANGLPRFQYIIKADSIGRTPQTKVVRSRVDKVYYLPGVTPEIASVNDIPVLNPTVIKTPFSQVTDTYGVDTNPTQLSYVDKINAKEWIVAEATSFRRWHGNIIEASTRYIVAE